jgi:hypothetical protein
LIFNEALQLQHNAVLRTLSRRWKRYATLYSPGGSGGVGGSPSKYPRTRFPYTHPDVRTASSNTQLGSFPGDVELFRKLQNEEKRNNGNPGSGTMEIKGVEIRNYYVDMKNKTSQWTRPYHEKTFFSQDLEVDAFITIMTQRDIFMMR